MSLLHRPIGLLAVGVLVIPVSGMATDRYGWLDTGFANTYPGLVGRPLALADSSLLQLRSDRFKSLAPDWPFGDEMTRTDPGIPDITVTVDPNSRFQFYGAMTLPDREQDPHAALRPAEAGSVDLTGSRFTGFGVQWRHQLTPVTSVALSAGYNEYVSPRATPNPDAKLGAEPASVGTSPAVQETSASTMASAPELDVLNTRAALSWSSNWGGALKPGVTGSVFVGDEDVREETYQYLARRYYGFTLGGEVTLFREHTPYVSYRMQRYSSDDPLLYPEGYAERSSISAGWRWQVQQNWSMQAEASYGLNLRDNNVPTVDLYRPDQNKLFFGTRFDFR